MKGLVGFILCVLTALVVSQVLTSCREEKRYYAQNIESLVTTPTMSTKNVDTYISDSGYTKYYIRTPLWDMYDDIDSPYWHFPYGVELEEYDTDLNIEATLRCDSATHFTRQGLWRLDGRVVMVNVMRDTFITNQVFWDKNRRKIYSDSFIHIVKTDRIIEGNGFVSNEAMTEYTVTQPTGIFPVAKQGKSAGAPAAVSEDEDYEFDEDSRRARAPMRASTRNAIREPEPWRLKDAPPIHR